MQTERRMAANPQSKTIDSAAENWLLLPTTTIAVVIITQSGVISTKPSVFIFEY